MLLLSRAWRNSPVNERSVCLRVRGSLLAGVQMMKLSRHTSAATPPPPPQDSVCLLVPLCPIHPSFCVIPTNQPAFHVSTVHVCSVEPCLGAHVHRRALVGRPDNDELIDEIDSKPFKCCFSLRLSCPSIPRLEGWWSGNTMISNNDKTKRPLSLSLAHPPRCSRTSTHTHTHTHTHTQACIYKKKMPPA